MAALTAHRFEVAPCKGMVTLLAAMAPPLCAHAVRARPTTAPHPEFQTDLAVSIAAFDSITCKGSVSANRRLAAAVLATRGEP